LDAARLVTNLAWNGPTAFGSSAVMRAIGSNAAEAEMMTMADSIGDVPAPDEIRTEIERMSGSDVFSRSPQLGAFLRFVVEAVLHGKADRIKAYTIGVEVLRRDTRFDPQLDPIVRVEATRLRRAIERYYAGPGLTDPIIIDLPRGSYVPTFRRREIEHARTAPIWAAIGRWSDHLHRPPTLAMVAIIVVTAVLAVASIILYGRSDRGMTTASVPARDFDGVQRVATLPPGNGMPTVQIEPLRVIGTPSPGAVAAERLHAKVSDAFARFDTINVTSNLVVASAGTDPSPDPRADYRLSGVVEYIGGTANAWFTLTSTAEAKVVWSRTFERVQTSGENGVTEDGIVITLTNSLLQSYGVIRARDRAKQLASNAGDPRYRCILEAADAIRTADRQSHELARTCLERLTEADPGFAVGFTFLALMYNREYQHEYELRRGDAPPLERALRAARQSIALHPESSRGYLALMVIQANRGDGAAARAAGEKCLTLNKYDMLALGEYGGRLLMAGDVAGGMTALREAGAHGAVRPAWHHIYMFIGSYISGDMAEAVRHANDIPSDNMALGQVARALAAKTAGNPDGVRRRSKGSWRWGQAGAATPMPSSPGLSWIKESSTGWRAT
jgi:hypothetical protein